LYEGGGTDTFQGGVQVKTFGTLFVLASVMAAVSVASAGDAKKTAELLFQEGQTLVAKGKYDQACPKFEESQRLDPAIGTLLNLAHCYELSGRVMSAWSSYVDAETLARQKKDKRAKGAHDHAADLAPMVPKLVVRVVSPPADLAVTIDGQPFDLALAGAPVPADPHAVTIAATAAGFEPFSKTVTLVLAETTTVDVELAPVKVVQPDVVVKPKPDKKPPPKPDPIEVDPERGAPRGGGQRILGLSLAGAGVLALGGGTVLALLARGDYQGAFDDGHCDATTGGCDTVGFEITDGARSKANIGGVVAGAGLVAVGIGVYLYLAAPHGRTYVAPTGGDGAIGLVFGGAL
jgi:hypothetical protein